MRRKGNRLCRCGHLEVSHATKDPHRCRYSATCGCKEWTLRVKPKKASDPTIYLPASDNVDHRLLPYGLRDKMRKHNVDDEE